MTDFAIPIPQNELAPEALRRYLARAEELGYHSAWTMEQILGQNPMLGPIELMTFAAAHTHRLRLGCAVLLAPHYSPLHLAKSLSSLDALSLGRLEIGLASGGPKRPLEAFGIASDGLITRFKETVELMKACWTRDRVDFTGRFYKLENGSMEPKPVQKPHPPIWYGGTARPAVERAARDADGFFGAGSTTTARFRKCVEILRQQPRRVRIAKRIYLTLHEDRSRAREIMESQLQRVYAGFGLENLLDVAVYGTVADVVAGVREVIEAGAELVLLHPLSDELQQIERLAREVVPALS